MSRTIRTGRRGDDERREVRFGGAIVDKWYIGRIHTLVDLWPLPIFAEPRFDVGDGSRYEYSSKNRVSK
jgi:hypothetical protein